MEILYDVIRIYIFIRFGSNFRVYYKLEKKKK